MCCSIANSLVLYVEFCGSILLKPRPIVPSYLFYLLGHFLQQEPTVLRREHRDERIERGVIIISIVAIRVTHDAADPLCYYSIIKTNPKGCSPSKKERNSQPASPLSFSLSSDRGFSLFLQTRGGEQKQSIAITRIFDFSEYLLIQIPPNSTYIVQLNSNHVSSQRSREIRFGSDGLFFEKRQ